MVSADAQTAPSAYKRNFGIYVGGLGSVFQPDFAGSGVGTGPKRLYGIGGYADWRYSRWVEIEAEVRFLHFNEYHPGPNSQGIYQNTYSIGPLVPITTWRKFTPYGKALVGWATMADLNGKALAFTYGGGVDYRLNRKFTVRVFDFEYQQWRLTPDDLYPYGGSVGISYKIF